MPTAPAKPWMERMASHVGGVKTMKNIGADAGMAAFFALGGFLTDDNGPLKDASPGTKRLLNAVFGAPMAGKILLPDLHKSWKERNVPDFLMTALTTTIGALGVGMNDRELINSAAMLATLFSIAGHLEDGVMEKSKEGIEALEKSVPKEVRRRVEVKGGGHRIETVNLDEIKAGDHVFVNNTVPVNGEVVDILVDNRRTDTASIRPHPLESGERHPKPVYAGTSKVFQGATVPEGTELLVKATSSGKESAVLHNVKLLRDAEKFPSRTVHSIENIVKHVYVPMILVACAAQFVASYYHDQKKHVLKEKIDDLKEKIRPKKKEAHADKEKKDEKPHGVQHRLEKSVKKTAEIAIKMAPCAITASMLLLPFLKNKLAAHHGIHVHEDIAFEKAKDIKIFVTDVTGTITKEVSKLVGPLRRWDAEKKIFTEIAHEAEHNKLLGMIAKAELKADHPMAQSLVQEARNRNIDLLLAHDELPAVHLGAGASGTFGKEKVVIGNKKLLESHGLPPELPAEAEQQFMNSSYFVHYDEHGGKQFGVAAFKDELKPEALEGFKKLKAQGVEEVVFLTGLSASATRHIANEVESHVKFAKPIELLPDHTSVVGLGKPLKVDAIEKLASRGKTLGFSGDGHNDATAMEKVKEKGGVAFAVSGKNTAGTTKQAASVLIEGIHQIPDLMSLSKKVGQALIINVSAAAAWMTFLVGSHVFGMEMKPEKASIAHEAPTVLLMIASLVQSFRLTRGLPARGI